ncbi:alpha-L-arabinofuranosidase C-terminal domain-containing protein [Mucilaginibacter phyllosphaerae]|uniref:non-reducing end alpha-L-arabinofuranosidase n=1 Tax=Mucilaginibacter phyllosphaerae TaxID=1812349 RepID=A0A4Y8AJM2_9SPHI|nr:alpha-L-arabinofuranosidase C-terminal domain-containing protein [Mucilaginibacter phyllosphaerae]MBB3968281.1 alpha-N-arabinofuranosidase [Mucilaginibacter phyllosphaerae]TEW68715.1 alpha-L-arabinofuranosidase [Mucilaginibacter phyllosphaerae]GGG99988.1 alpha-L-arabinofuranosidase [Mucilaginibacter phyllosphaerae]
MKRVIILFALTFVCFAGICQQTKVYTIAANQVKAKVSPYMYGIFFEDINMAADGGVYAELVKNRSFEFNTALTGWKEQQKNGGAGKVTVVNRADDRPENPHVITVDVTSPAGYFGLSNEGFRGMGIKKGETYNFTVMARKPSKNSTAIQVELHSAKGLVIGKAQLAPVSTNWQKYHVQFVATATDSKASLFVWLKGKGSVDLDMISLFPAHTWKNRPAGLRADLVQKLADLKPGFLRFPGGCIVEGRDLANRYQWKKSIGDIDKRENIINRWNTEFAHRPTPDYYQTFGLGFMEYFLTAEDIGASPLPILNCGMACQFNTGQLVALDKLDPYVQDALDLIEFANGGLNTKWGKLRADLGHPKPFNLKMMGVGNEQWGEQYIDRWKVFTKAIKDKYPYIQIISSVGPYASGKEFDLLNTTFRGLNADILDEHYYNSPKWFLDHANRYDNYDRKGPKIFAGEYAAQSKTTGSPDNKNTLECALAEAAFMTGLERNADVVVMASYAPLFAHVDAWQWTPDLIWFDNLRSYGTPNYYVQQLYSLNKGTDVIPLLDGDKAVSGQDGSYATACLDKSKKELIIKFVNSTDKSQSVEFNISGINISGRATMISLGNTDKTIMNSLDKPMAISPITSTMVVNGKAVKLSVAPNTFKVIKLKTL